MPSVKSAIGPIRNVGYAAQLMCVDLSCFLGEEVDQRQRNNLGRLGKVGKRQTLIGAMRIRLLDRMRPSSVQHDRYALRGVVARVGIERHALGVNVFAHDLRSTHTENFRQLLASSNWLQWLGK